MLIGIFDILVFGLITYLNVHLWKQKPITIIQWLLASFICLFLFALFLPFISAEIEKLTFNWMHQDEIVDGFEGLYIFLRWPTYWVLGFLEILYLLLITFGAPPNKAH